MYKHNITFGNHVKNTWGILVFAIVSISFRYFMIYRHGLEDIEIFNLLALTIFLIFFIPQTILHLKYYFLNRDRTFYYLPSEQRLILEINQIEYNFRLQDIESVERSKSIPLAEDRGRWFPWDNYNYSIIQLKNGQRFIVTSLLVPNMDLPLGADKIKLRKRFYCYPFGVKECLIKEESFFGMTGKGILK